MKIKELFDEWSLTGLKINIRFLEMDWKPKDEDKDASWEMYVELLTRVATQPLPDKDGDEETALKSVYGLFETTRNILKNHGRHCENFAKISIIILNQIIRPFTAKWHKIKVEKGIQDDDTREEFRRDLKSLQEKLCSYSKMLASIANVEDMTDLEVL